jgi:hypothetical protein
MNKEKPTNQGTPDLSNAMAALRNAHNFPSQMNTFAFTDIAGEHFMVLGSAGTSWLPLEKAPEFVDEVFQVRGENNAHFFAAWIRNEHHCHTQV